jgi:transketolase
MDGYDSRVYVLLGDGEMDEGQVWEAAMAAHKFKLDHLVAIVDQNKYQQTGPTEVVLDLRPVAPRWEASGWFTQEVDGHDLEKVLGALKRTEQQKGRPSCIVARTIKGYPIIDLLGGDHNHHGKPLTPDEEKRALAYLDSH